VIAPAHFPSSGSFVLKNASVPSAVLGQPILPVALQRLDLTITDGIVTHIAPAGVEPTNGESYDLDAGLVFPAFVDLHTHLDKGHIWPRKANPDGSFMGALLAVAEDRETKWSARDVERRMEFALRCAYAHGTAAIRTHLDSAPPQHEVTWDIFEAVRERWAGKIELQGVALIGPELLLDEVALLAVARRAKAAGGRLGGAIADFPEARRAIYRAVDLAGTMGMDIDLHCDETLAPGSSALRHLADAVIETGFTGRSLAGHCCVLSVQDEPIARATIERVAEAGVSIVSLPMCNMYLQDRDTARSIQTPRYRGVTLVNEFKAAGVPVALASDNTRDPFYAYGDLDPLEVFREGARITHLDHPQSQAWSWSRAVGADAAAIGGFGYKSEIAIGAPADLVLCRARQWTELHSRPQTDRIVLRGGKPIDSTLPDYRELDDLME
jgi:cytosine deaminase